jgi:hypothetical protein
MPPNSERRPRQEGGAQDTANVTFSLTQDYDAVSYMRRRRQASWRLSVLASGRHDPFDGIRRPVADIPCSRAVVGLDGRWRPCCRRGAG